VKDRGFAAYQGLIAPNGTWMWDREAKSLVPVRGYTPNIRSPEEL